MWLLLIELGMNREKSTCNEYNQKKLNKIHWGGFDTFREEIIEI